jgi:hypothetical protein
MVPKDDGDLARCHCDKERERERERERKMSLGDVDKFIVNSGDVGLAVVLS